MNTPRVAVLVALSLAACTKTKTDAQRATEEREVIRKRTEGATIQAQLHRRPKTVARSQAAGSESPSFATVGAALEKTEQPPAEVKTAEDAARVGAVFLELGRALHAARADLERNEEDDFPLLWLAPMKEPAPWAWYDGPAEQLPLACAARSLEVGSWQRGTLDVVL